MSSGFRQIDVFVSASYKVSQSYVVKTCMFPLFFQWLLPIITWINNSSDWNKYRLILEEKSTGITSVILVINIWREKLSSAHSWSSCYLSYITANPLVLHGQPGQPGQPWLL